MATVQNYKLFPKDKDELLSEIKKIFDDYDKNRLNNKDFCELLYHYENNYMESFCREDKDTGEVKVTDSTKKRLGKNRSNRLEMVLNCQMFVKSDYEE